VARPGMPFPGPGRISGYKILCAVPQRWPWDRSMITRSTRSDTVTSTQPETGKSSTEEAGAESCRQKNRTSCNTAAREQVGSGGELELESWTWDTSTDTEDKAGQGVGDEPGICGVSARKWSGSQTATAG
jgi:hypothetical protein